MRRGAGFHRLGKIAAWVATVLALTNLPASRFAPAWTLGFVVPAAILYLLLGHSRLHPGAAVAAALTIQILAILGLDELFGAPEMVAALGLTLVPPLIFLQCRSQGRDSLRALFLAFCVFLVGVILGTTSPLVLLGFLVSTVTSLYFHTAAETLTSPSSWRTEPAPTSRRLSSGLSQAVIVLVLCSICFQGFRMLPAPASPEASRTPSNQGNDTADRAPVSGLSQSFEFDGSNESPIRLGDEELLEVRTSVPERSLYLRGTYFDIARIDEWLTAPLDPGREAQVSPRIPGLPIRRLSAEVLAPDLDMVLVPQGSLDLSGVRGAQVDYGLGLVPGDTRLRQGQSYGVAYQDLSGAAGFQPAQTAEDHYYELGPRIRENEVYFLQILDTARRRAPNATPYELAESIGSVLRERCTYSLETPSGPFAHPLLNFLQGDRQGFCMYFASAAAICLRLAGIPCRIGVGLQGGESDLQDPRKIVLGARHAHAWVEIPLVGIGWQIIDPSPAVDLGEMGRWPGADPDGAWWEDNALAVLNEHGTLDMFADPLDYPVFWLALLTLLIASLAWRPRLRKTRVATGTIRITRGRARPVRKARRALQRLGRELEKRGPLRRGRSLEAWCREIESKHSLPGREVRLAFASYQEVRFGGAEFDETREDAFRRALTALRDAPVSPAGRSPATPAGP